MGWKDWLGLTVGRDEFAQDLSRRAAKRGVPGWTYEPAEAVLTHAGRGGKFFITNAWLEYSGAQRAARPALIEKYLSMMLDGPPEVPKLWDLAAKNLCACLRSRYQTLTSEIECRGMTPPFIKPVSMPWHGDLDIVLMYDFGPYLAQVLPETADAWGQSLEALFARAKANLTALTRPTWGPLGDGIFKIVSEVSFEESFVLVDAVWSSLPVQGDPVVAVPNRGVLLVSGGTDGSLGRLIAEAQRSMQENPWPLSALLMQRVSGRWQPFTPGAELAPAARTFELVSLAGTYSEQQQALEKYFEQSGVDIYVAKFDLMGSRSAPEAMRSWCSWAEGVPSLLPRTDVVVLGRQGEAARAVIAPWEVVERLCGHYMQRTDEDPPRFRVESFPETEWPQLLEAGETLG